MFEKTSLSQYISIFIYYYILSSPNKILSLSYLLLGAGYILQPASNMGKNSSKDIQR